jgi:uncharacterized protein
MSIEERPVEMGSVEGVTVDGFPMILEESHFHPLPKALPVDGAERVNSVDVIRGVALMGILAMNIVSFAWPHQVYETPILDPGYGRDHLFLDTKMMTLFSMLFGAGLVLMSDRAEGRGVSLLGVYYRRVSWLLVIGLFHAYLIWVGDILVWYAQCGFLLYPVRKWPARRLILVGIALNLIAVVLWAGFRFGVVTFMHQTSQRVEAQAKAGGTSKDWEKQVAEGWKGMMQSEPVTPASLDGSIRVHRGGYAGIVRDRAWGLLMGHTFGFVFFTWWFIGGRMLIGMGLMKLGVFSARLSNRSYAIMMAIGYGIGLPLMLFDVIHQTSHGFFLDQQRLYYMAGWPLITWLGSLPVVFGHIGLVMLICRNGALPWLTHRLGAAGRMALSCYLFDSIVCTTLFYGYGFNLFGTLHRPMLYLIVLSIWAAQLLVCPIWLSRFRFGPAEWLWRSLTYWKFQSMTPKVA